MDYTHISLANIKILGPLKEMLVDYWHLIWQERPCVVVMVTNLVESGENKCEQYWPSTTTQHASFGPFDISLIEEQIIFSYFVQRVIQ